MPKKKKTIEEDPTIDPPKKKAGEGRTRNFATIVYPESLPDDWLSRLEDEKVPALVSPIHDRDLNQSSENELKKPHYHVIVMFSSVKTEEQFENFCKRCFNNGYFGTRKVESIRGYVRYLCHLDSGPDKVKYNENDIIALCGADYYGLKEIQTDKLKIIDDMCEWCVNNDVDDIFELIEYARANQREWFRELAFSSTLFMREYLRSSRFIRAKRKAEQWKRETNEPG